MCLPGGFTHDIDCFGLQRLQVGVPARGAIRCPALLRGLVPLMRTGMSSIHEASGRAIACLRAEISRRGTVPSTTDERCSRAFLHRDPSNFGRDPMHSWRLALDVERGQRDTSAVEKSWVETRVRKQFALVCAGMLLAGCAYDPPMAGDHQEAPKDVEDLHACQETAGKAAHQAVIRRGDPFLSYPVLYPIEECLRNAEMHGPEGIRSVLKIRVWRSGFIAGRKPS